MSYLKTGQQILDAGNTATRTAADGATQFVGSWTRTRKKGIVRQLTVLASNVSSGLGGTFIFEFSEDGATATISETRMITSFATVRDFDLINAGAYYRVKFTPDRALVGGELVFITTTQRTQNDGVFVRLADQQIEKQNAAMGQVFSYLKGFNSVGISQDFLMTDQGNMITADFLTEVQKGNIDGHSLIVQSGVNPDIDTGFETIWGVGGIYTPPAVNTVMTFTVNVADILLGLTANITGLNGSGNVVTETLALNAIAKLSVNTYSALQHVYLTGLTAPANDITISINAATVSTITAGTNATRVGYYHIPTGYTAYLIRLSAGNSNNSASSNLTRIMRKRVGTGFFTEIANFAGHSQSSSSDLPFTAPYIFTAGEVIRIDMTCGANNNIGCCTMSILLIAD